MNTEKHQNSEEHVSSLMRIIKEKIGYRVININSNNSLFLDQKKIKSLSCDSIILEDESSLLWDDVSNINDLVSILIWLEDWLKAEELNWISIRWSIYDFEDVAKEKEESENLEIGAIYDRSKFLFALKVLEEHHDCNYGITWTDIKSHLDEYCKLIQ